MGYSMIADAGNLDPDAPPAPTMKTMQEVYDAVQATQAAVVTSGSPSISEREGYCKHINMPQYATTTILTVPAGKKFVLRKLWVGSQTDVWSIQGGGVHIDWSIVTTLTSGIYSLMWDFPDGCVVVEGPDVLTFANTGGGTINTNYVGYFYDVP